MEEEKRMYPIITSMLTNDLYKISMMNYVLALFPNVEVEYRFKNRGKQRFTKKFVERLRIQIDSLKDAFLSGDDFEWMKKTFLFLSPGFLEYFKNFKFNPSLVSVKLTEDNNLDLVIKGKWIDTILFEVPILAIISELYFTTIDTQYAEIDDRYTHSRIEEKNIPEQIQRAKDKIKTLSDNGCLFMDFGTRRRRSHLIQSSIIQAFVDFTKENPNSTFLGSSNLYFAKKHNILCLGSMAHEIILASQVLNSYNHCNYYAMENWLKVYGNLEIGTALCDSVGTPAFLRDFNKKLSTLFKSTRQDSGNPLLFVDRMLEHYKTIGIDSREKTIIFSDNLNVDKCIEIKKYCEGKIKCSFGIGTFLTNQGFLNSPPLNMVIKLYSVKEPNSDRYIPVVKLGDGEDKGKEMGDPQAIRVARWFFKGESLDS